MPATNNTASNGIDCRLHAYNNGCGAAVAATATIAQQQQPPQPPSSAGGEEWFEVPAWLDEAFVAHAYGEFLGEPVRCESLRVEPVTAKGENYASEMYRVHALYATGKDVSIAYCVA